MRSVEMKGRSEELVEQTIRLRMEEVIFKMKSRLQSLLQEISVPARDLAKFNELGKVE